MPSFVLNTFHTVLRPNNRRSDQHEHKHYIKPNLGCPYRKVAVIWIVRQSGSPSL